MLRDYAFGDLGDPAHRGVRKVKARLLVLHEARVESAAPLVPGVGADHREPADESRHAAGRKCAERELDGAVQTPATPGNRKRPFQVSGRARANPIP